MVNRKAVLRLRARRKLKKLVRAKKAACLARLKKRA